MLVSSVQCSNLTFIPYDAITIVSVVPICHIHSYYDIIDYFPCAVLYTPRAYLFYNWKLVALIPFHLFHPFPSPRSSGNHQWVLVLFPPHRIPFNEQQNCQKAD